MSDPRCNKCGSRELKFINNYFESHMMAYGHAFEPLVSATHEEPLGPYSKSKDETHDFFWIEGPGIAHMSMDELSADAYCARLNTAFAQGQAQSAREVEELKKTLANIPINGEDEARIAELEAEVSRLRGLAEGWMKWAENGGWGDYGNLMADTRKALNPPSEREGK